jgi:integrase/recombinase XerD
MSLQEYLQPRYTEQTVKVYLFEIDNYTTNYSAAASAVYSDIVNYMGMLRTRYSNPATLNRILACIKVYYDYLCYTGVRSDNPARSVRLRDKRCRDIQLQDLFTQAELEALLHRREKVNNLVYRNRVLISLLIYQALQPGEIEALTLPDINLDSGSICIKATGKTNKRELQLRPGQILLFYQYIHEIRPKLLQRGKCATNDFLLLGLQGEAMKAGDITNHIKRSYKDLYPGRQVSAQTIRQSVIANLLKQGHDLSLVQSFAGHKYPSSTERYKQSQIETLKAAVQKYHPFA